MTQPGTSPLPGQKALCCPGRGKTGGFPARHLIFQDVKKTGGGFRTVHPVANYGIIVIPANMQNRCMDP